MFRLLKYMKPYTWQCFAIVLAVGLQVYGALMLPTMMAEIVNSGIMKNDTSFIITVPTKFGPCLEVVEQLNNLYDDININVVFGNGDIRGEITVNDYGEIFLENKEPSISKAFHLLDALGMFESHGEKLGWTTIHAEEAGLLDRVDE